MIQPACIKTWSTASEMQKSQREIWRSFENICVLSFLNWVATVRNSGKIINFWQIGSGRCCVVHQGAAVSIIHKIICFTSNKGDMGHQGISTIESHVANLVVIIHYQLTVVKWFLNYDSQNGQIKLFSRWETEHWWRWSSFVQAQLTRAPFKESVTSLTHSSRCQLSPPLQKNKLFEALTTLYPHLTLSGGDCLKFQPEHNLVTCLAHLEYRGLHCIVLQLLDTNIRQVGAVLMLEMRWRQWWRWTWWSWCDVDDYYIIIIFLIVTTVFTKVIYKNGRRGLSPWATNKFGNDLLVALQTLHKVSW